MAETSKNQWFNYLEHHADGKPLPFGKQTGPWIIRRPPDTRYLVAQCESAPEKKLTLMAGQQIRTAEGLEILALITRKRFEDGLPASLLTLQIADAGALTVIPWGFGKWLGKRGRILSGMLSEKMEKPFFIGDNQGRPLSFKKPFQFRQATEIGCRILPGSDPFPFSREQYRAGSFGFFSNFHFSAARAADDLLSIVRNRNTEIRPFGCRLNAVSFLVKQTAMQLRKMKHWKRSAAI